MKQIFFVLVTLFLAGNVPSSFADQAHPVPQAPTCVLKTVVFYTPGPHWAGLQAAYPAHVQYVGGLLSNNTVSVGGPLLDAAGAPEGGMLIYNLADVAKVTELTQADPFVAQGVVNYSVKPWQACSAQ